MDRGFAEDYPRDENGWVVFPHDVSLRRELFPKEAFDHPAKANLWMVKEMGRYLAKPGDSILDPFAGTGSQMISALDDRKVVLIELEPYFIDIIKQTLDNWEQAEMRHKPVIYYQGDCRQKLLDMPFKVDSVIFSPPYSTTMASTGIKATGAEDDTGTGRYQTKEYTRSALNLSRLNPFMYEQHLGRVFERIAMRVVPGGKMCVITKDRIEGPNRINLSEAPIRQARKNGFRQIEWLKHAPPSTIAKASAAIALKKHGREVKVVLDEDLLIFEREQ